ncbi:MAG: hypothetical protein WB973_17115 [Thermoanaerobaculia bacterium]
MNRLIKFFLDLDQARHRAQALAFERRQQATTAVRRSIEDVIRSLDGGDTVSVFELPDRQSLKISRRLFRRHAVLLGSTGHGKSVCAMSLLIAEIDRALDTAVLSGKPLDIEIMVIDIKDDICTFKQRIAAIFHLASVPKREVMRSAFHLIQWKHSGITLRPLLVPRPGVSIEYVAELQADIVVQTSPSDWSDSLRFLLFQMLRLLLQHDFAFDGPTVIAILTDETFRLTLTNTLPVDLAEFFTRLAQLMAPQTIAAFIRRVLIFCAYREVAASICIPWTIARDLQLPTGAPIVLADCGSRSLLPPNVALAEANALITELLLAARARDPRVPLIAYIEEALYLLTLLPSLRQRVLDGLRLLRSSGTSVWFSAQSFASFPGAAVSEILNNIGFLVAFQSRSDVADMLFPQMLVQASETRSKTDRRDEFASQLASLPPQEAVLWVKPEPAIRVRSSDVQSPSVTTGLSGSALEDIFDRELTPRSTISLDRAESLMADWRAAHLPQAKGGKHQDAATQASLRSLLGLGEEHR